MCGINGSLGLDPSVVERMNLAIIHRGPDHSGVSAMAGTTIGMDRLAILDLNETGQQPMTTRDGRFTIVFNGEIYNCADLRKELEAQGVSFRGHSDTEVIVEGYGVWGKEVTRRLRGMWALCIRDNQTQELFLSRDPFGIKPLYVFDKAGSFVFSSEIKGLLAHPSVPRVIRPDAVTDLLLLGYVVAPKTILQDVEAFVPGEERLVGIASGTRERWIQKLETDPISISHAPSDTELSDVLERSVSSHLNADVPVGLFFSGGMDSTLIAAMLSKLGHHLTAYHVAIESRNDTPYARRIAEHLRLPFVEIPFGARDVPAVLDRYWQIMDQPFADASLLPTLVVSDRAVQDVKVVLSGEGGDELFAGYPRHRRMAGLVADAARSQRSTVEQLWRTAIRHAPSLITNVAKADGLLRRIASRRGDAIRSFVAETTISHGLVDSTGTVRTISERIRERETPDKALALDRLVYLPDDLLTKIDIATMASSLEGRVPFLDREVFRAVGAASMEWKRAGGLSKSPLRRVLRPLLPGELIDRPKTGFSVPLSSYLFAHEDGQIRISVEWYLKSQFAGLHPSLDAELQWGLTSKERWSTVSSQLAYTLFAIRALYAFQSKLNSPHV